MWIEAGIGDSGFGIRWKRKLCALTNLQSRISNPVSNNSPGRGGVPHRREAANSRRGSTKWQRHTKSRPKRATSKARVRAAACVAPVPSRPSSTAATRPGQHPARPQRRLAGEPERVVLLVDPRPRPRRQRAEGAAARHAAPSVQAAHPAPGLPARRRERGDPHPRAAALPQPGKVAGRQDRGRGGHARAERRRNLLPAEGPAGVHRGRPVRTAASATSSTCPT